MGHKALLAKESPLGLAVAPPLGPEPPQFSIYISLVRWGGIPLLQGEGSPLLFLLLKSCSGHVRMTQDLCPSRSGGPAAVHTENPVLRA